MGNGLTRYISDGRMPIDNNILECDIRVLRPEENHGCSATLLTEPGPAQ
ncbi:transposase [Brucella intermedia]|nr:transposase [Brucella intermedia]KAB2709116.1 transposase [Brucella intermedia]RQP21034.1 MAG: hypothetical protein EAS49_00560 [Brucella intermedia]HCH72579.1 hypothetical protein [Ochrobactrum sp.]